MWSNRLLAIIVVIFMRSLSRLSPFLLVIGALFCDLLVSAAECPKEVLGIFYSCL